MPTTCRKAALARTNWKAAWAHLAQDNVANAAQLNAVLNPDGSPVEIDLENWIGDYLRPVATQLSDGGAGPDNL